MMERTQKTETDADILASRVCTLFPFVAVSGNSQGFYDAEGSALRCVVQKKNFTFIFQLPGWALVALSCFSLQAILAQ